MSESKIKSSWDDAYSLCLMLAVDSYGIITAILNYVVDGYGHYSASALGGVVFIRNIVGAIFPLCEYKQSPCWSFCPLADMVNFFAVAEQMFVGMGNQWALFLLAMVSCFLVPIPFYLYYKGKQVRAASPYCATHFGEE